MATPGSTVRYLSALTAVTALGIAMGQPGYSHATAVSAASSVADVCANPLPVDYRAEGGGPALRFTEVRGGPNRFELIQFPGSTVGRFTFVAGSRAYLGPTHILQYGAVRRVCAMGLAAVEREQGGHEYGPARHVTVRLAGTVTGTSGRVTLRVGRTMFYVFGPTSLH